MLFRSQVQHKTHQNQQDITSPLNQVETQQNDRATSQLRGQEVTGGLPFDPFDGANTSQHIRSSFNILTTLFISISVLHNIRVSVSILQLSVQIFETIKIVGDISIKNILF